MSWLRKNRLQVVVAFAALPIVGLGLVALSILNYARKSDPHAADAAIVLGAAVANGEPTPVFEQRIAHAINLYHSGVVPALILTGGVGVGDTLAESEVARSYCLARGVPVGAIHIETVSHSTTENLRQARAVASELGARRVLIVSDPLHERRAVTIARDLGFDAYPSPTPTTRYTGLAKQSRFLARETYFYARYLFYRSIGRDATELAVAPEFNCRNCPSNQALSRALTLDVRRFQGSGVCRWSSS
jgi:uncharacterized SAM-binding protein YcdF (DUF218 family)